MKKLLSVFFVFLLSIFPIIGVTYDYFIDSYDISKTNNTNIIYVSKANSTLLNSLSGTYSFSDGSKVSVTLQWLKITQSKIDFITNYQWFFIEKIVTNSDTNLQKAKNTHIPTQNLLLTWAVSWKKSSKEKMFFNQEMTFLDAKNIIFHFNFMEYNVFIQKHFEPYSLRWPPNIISLTLV